MYTMINPKFLTVYHINPSNKIRYGHKRDGGYVIMKLNVKYDCYISCGVGKEESFTRDFLAANRQITPEHSYAFDGTIKKYPRKYSKTIQFIRKNISAHNNKRNTNLINLLTKYNNIFLSMDIEGGEFPWLISLDKKYLKHIAQIVIEIHGLTSNDKWGSDVDTKNTCLHKLRKTHILIHAHGNNNAPVINGIPNVIELTYINRKYFKGKPKLNKNYLPSKLDASNRPNKRDIILNHAPFVFK